VDNAGNRTAKTDQRTAVATSYGYDNIYQLLSATQGATTTESYTYDPVGNRLTQNGSATWSYNPSNELTSRPGVTYTYDNNGNTLTKVDSTGTTQYFWDYENRLSSVTLPGTGGTVSFKYDPFGRRIYKSSSSGTSIFAYDGDNLVEETNSSGTAVARYSDGLNIDEPLAMLRSATTSFYDADGLGSITSLSSTAGALAQTYTFDSFGKQTASSGSLTNPFQYTARESDPETGLYYYRARYYDPAVGRFTSEDPTGFAQGPNFYIYVFNSPVAASDPTGLDARCSTHFVFTWCNWWWPGSEQPSDAFKQGAYIHEMQHQSDNLLMALAIGGGSPPAAALANLVGLTPAGCRVLEGRAFAAEISFLKKRIQVLKKKKCLSDEEKKQLDDLNQTLQGIANQTDPFLLKVYCSAK
jgi:RHS repeat-associated protein